MMIVVILWVLVGLFFTWYDLKNYNNGIIPALIGLIIPVYIWQQFDISYSIALAIYPISAFFSSVLIASTFFTIKEGSFRDEQIKKEAEKASKIDPAVGLSEHITLLHRGLR